MRLNLAFFLLFLAFLSVTTAEDFSKTCTSNSQCEHGHSCYPVDKSGTRKCRIDLGRACEKNSGYQCVTHTCYCKSDKTCYCRIGSKGDACNLDSQCKSKKCSSSGKCD